MGSDKNCYFNFRMYKMFLKAGYDIKIKKVLQFKQDNVFKKYVENLYEMKKQYSLKNKKGMSFLVKIMLNSLYGSMLVNKERFRNFKVITNEKQAEKYNKSNNIHRFIEVNENFNIIELKVLFNNNNNNIKKCEYYKIIQKDGKLLTKLQEKDDISNFNDKMYMVDNLISKPHEINV